MEVEGEVQRLFGADPTALTLADLPALALQAKAAFGRGTSDPELTQAFSEKLDELVKKVGLNSAAEPFRFPTGSARPSAGP